MLRKLLLNILALLIFNACEDKTSLNEPDSLCADITQLRSLGWSPTINILERIRENAIT